MPVSLSHDFGYAVIAAALEALEVILIGFMVSGRARGKVFQDDILAAKFGDEHRAATGQNMNKGGYPDMGTGRYSDTLSYSDWLYFNKAQRIHYNLVEQVGSMITFTLLAGIYYPKWAFGNGLGWIVARVLYCGYLNDKGAEDPFRRIGAIMGDITLLLNFICAFGSGIRLLVE